MIVLRDVDRDLILEQVVYVLQAGFGNVLVTIKDHKVLDVIPSPRIRTKEELGRTTQSGSSNGRV